MRERGRALERIAGEDLEARSHVMAERVRRLECAVCGHPRREGEEDRHPCCCMDCYTEQKGGRELGHEGCPGCPMEIPARPVGTALVPCTGCRKPWSAFWTFPNKEGTFRLCSTCYRRRCISCAEFATLRVGVAHERLCDSCSVLPLWRRKRIRIPLGPALPTPRLERF